MKLYEGPHLTISFENGKDRFVQFWNTPLNCIDSFKKEMLMYTSLYKKHKPSQTLWLQQDFTLNLGDNTFTWIENYVNIPCYEYGNKKAAFVVGKDVMAHLRVIDSFEKEKSIINVAHFATEEEAKNWLNETFQQEKEEVKTQIIYEGIDEDGNSILKVSSNDIVRTIKSFNDLIEENDFIKINKDKFSTLTNREKEILQLYSNGLRHKQIADKLFISLNTVKTHWRNTKKKLEISSFNDIIKYTKAFFAK